MKKKKKKDKKKQKKQMEEDFEKRIEEILDSVSIDALLGNNANFLSRYAGLTYYASVEGQTLIGTQKTETVAGITYAKNIGKIHNMYPIYMWSDNLSFDAPAFCKPTKLLLVLLNNNNYNFSDLMKSRSLAYLCFFAKESRNS